MTTKKLLILSFMLLPALAMGKNQYGIDEKNPEAKAQIKLIEDFRLMPFREDLQEKILKSYGETINYTRDEDTYNTMKLLYINTLNSNFKEEAQIKLDTGVLGENIPKSKEPEKVFKRTKALSEDSIIQVLYLDSIGKKQEAKTKYEEKGVSRSDLSEVFYALRYLTENGRYEEAREIFFTKVDKSNLKNEKDKKNKDTYLINMKKGSKVELTKIYALAGVFEEQSKKDRILKIIKNLDHGSDLYFFYAYRDSFKKENFGNAAIYLEELRKNHPSKSLELELVSVYKKDSFKKIMDGDTNGAWISSRKALNIVESSKYGEELKNDGISLKRTLLKSSARLVHELSEKGEYSQAKRVQQETSRLMALKLF